LRVRWFSGPDPVKALWESIPFSFEGGCRAYPKTLPSMILSPLRIDTGSMTKKEKVMKLVDESTGLMECLVCGAKHNAVMKPGPDGKYLPENWECVNRCTLIHHDEKSPKK
jgi:hypothetical protein